MVQNTQYKLCISKRHTYTYGCACKEIAVNMVLKESKKKRSISGDSLIELQNTLWQKQCVSVKKKFKEKRKKRNRKASLACRIYCIKYQLAVLSHHNLVCSDDAFCQENCMCAD